MHQFKEKSAKQRDLVSADLFFYPVLMAADVLAYRAHEVPVGDDQRQHVELMRDVAQRFNERFGETLVVPELRTPTVGARIMDLQDPTSKMSTTSGSPEGTVYVLDDAKTVEKKFKRAVTDSEDPPRIVRDRSKPGVSNLIDILAAAEGITPEQVEADMAGARGYGDLKVATATAVNALLDPVRERYAALRADEDALEAIFAAGAAKARAITGDTLADVRQAIGVGPRG
jgi:tryptophanyl-tRNA synthetase